ncbi:hypothetical protein V2J09_019255 [Rumex salicifolius]
MEDFRDISNPRMGHKREFAFAVKSQYEIAASLGQTRTRKPPIGVQQTPVQRLKKPVKGNNGGKSEAAEKRREIDDETKGDSESSDVESTGDVAQKDLTDCSTGGGEDGGDDVATKAVPMKVKDLLRTGLLEGLPVLYRRAAQRKPDSTGTHGVVRGSGIKCFCQTCKGVSAVISPNMFELHAGSRNKRPADHIFMKNGKTFRDVLNACLECKTDDLEDTILKASGLRAAENNIPYEFEEISESANEDDSEDISESAATEASEECLEIASNNPLEETSRKRLTRKHCRRHKLVFENDTVLPEGTDLFYNFHGKLNLSLRNRIGCLVTNEVLEFSACAAKRSPSQFEAHAGWGCHKQPYHHIFTSKGTSLYMLAMSVSGKQDEHDEICNICQLEGYSICCSGCPRVFHKECVHLQEVPNDTWYCRSCRYQRYKVVGNSTNLIAAAEIDSKERLCMRLAETEESIEPDRGGCFLCRLHDFVKEGFDTRTIILCDQCEREYHVGCLHDFGMQDLKELPQGNWFCSNGCNRINSTLEQLIEEGGRQIPDSLMNIILAKHAAKDSNGAKLDVEWRLLSGKMSGADSVEQLFSDAISIFHEQFSPIFIPGSKTDLIPCMVFGKNLEDKDFGGMYCAVLTVNSQVVSAGVFRVYGTEIAELPLVATAKYCEKLGYFQALYFCLENLLGEMEVKHLSLPATNEAKPMWTNKLGFSKFPKDELAKVGRWYQLMPFEGTSMLRKAVPKISY